MPSHDSLNSRHQPHVGWSQISLQDGAYPEGNTVCVSSTCDSNAGPTPRFSGRQSQRNRHTRKPHAFYRSATKRDAQAAAAREYRKNQTNKQTKVTPEKVASEKAKVTVKNRVVRGKSRPVGKTKGRRRK
eukprot:1148544-Prorocentrum_minimum.AAC.3